VALQNSNFQGFLATRLSLVVLCLCQKIAGPFAVGGSWRWLVDRSLLAVVLSLSLPPKTQTICTMSSKPITTFWRFAGMSYLQVRHASSQ
jgi:hypothetical protein